MLPVIEMQAYRDSFHGYLSTTGQAFSFLWAYSCARCRDVENCVQENFLQSQGLLSFCSSSHPEKEKKNVTFSFGRSSVLAETSLQMKFRSDHTVSPTSAWNSETFRLLLPRDG